MPTRKNAVVAGLFKKVSLPGFVPSSAPCDRASSLRGLSSVRFGSLRKDTKEFSNVTTEIHRIYHFLVDLEEAELIVVVEEAGSLKVTVPI